MSTFSSENLTISSINSLKEGLYIKGKITEINGKDIVLRLENGEILEAKTNMALDNIKNLLCTFLVKGVEDNIIYLLPIDQGISESSNILNNNPEENLDVFIKKVLENYNIPNNKENVHIIRSLLSFKMSLSQENIDKAVKSLNKVSTLNDTQIGDKIIALDTESSLLDDNIMKLIKVNSNTEFIINNYDNDVDNSFTDLTDKSVQRNENSNMSFKDATEVVSTKLQSIFPEHTTSTNIIDKIVLLMKLGAEVSIGNLEVLSNSLDRGKGVIKLLLEFANQLKAHSQDDKISSKEGSDTFSKISTNILEINHESNINKENVKSFLNSIKELLGQIDYNIRTKKNEFSKSNIELDRLLQDIELHNKMNSYYSFLQIPIKLNDEKDNSHVTILKKKSKLRKDTYILYISLNTKNLKRVDLLCNINQENIRLDFKVEKEFIQHFSRKAENLSRILKGLGYQNVIINIEEDRENGLMSIFMDDDLLSNYNIDIRV